MSRINKVHTVIYSLLVLALVIISIMWLRARKSEEKMATAVNNSYDRAFKRDFYAVSGSKIVLRSVTVTEYKSGKYSTVSFSGRRLHICSLTEYD